MVPVVLFVTLQAVVAPSGTSSHAIRGRFHYGGRSSRYQLQEAQPGGPIIRIRRPHGAHDRRERVSITWGLFWVGATGEVYDAVQVSTSQRAAIKIELSGCG